MKQQTGNIKTSLQQSLPSSYTLSPSTPFPPSVPLFIHTHRHREKKIMSRHATGGITRSRTRLYREYREAFREDISLSPTSTGDDIQIPLTSFTDEDESGGILDAAPPDWAHQHNKIVRDMEQIEKKSKTQKKKKKEKEKEKEKNEERLCVND